MIQLTLNSVEIQKALKAHVATLGIDLAGKTVQIDLIAGRKEKGHTATVTISDGNEPVEVVTEEQSEPTAPVPNQAEATDLPVAPATQKSLFE